MNREPEAEPVRGHFVGHLSAEFPSQINVDLTEFCNLACSHCPYETVIKPKGRQRRHFSPDLNRKLIDEIAGDGRGHCRFIRYTAEGEPLLHPHLLDILAYAGAHAGVPINLTTNGVLLDANRAAALLDAGVTVFDISIDAHSAESYAQVRAGGAAYETVRDNTVALIRAAAQRRNRAKVIVSFISQAANRHEAAEFERFWRDAGADFVVIRPLHSAGGSIPDTTASLWRAAPQPRFPCLYPWERLLVQPGGEVTYCPVDWHARGIVGSLNHQTIREIWRGEEMEALRRAHRDNTFSAHGFCGACPDWSLTRWPDEGRATYASMMETLAGGSQS